MRREAVEIALDETATSWPTWDAVLRTGAAVQGATPPPSPLNPPRPSGGPRNVGPGFRSVHTVLEPYPWYHWRGSDVNPFEVPSFLTGCRPEPGGSSCRGRT